MTPEIQQAIILGLGLIAVNICGWIFTAGKITQRLNTVCDTVNDLCRKVDTIIPQIGILQVKVQRLEDDRYGERSKKYTETEGGRTTESKQSTGA